MTMIQIVQQLQAEGHEVDYYVRKDGGILVRKIDGEVYSTGASGNARARQIAGASISEARVKQLKYATRGQRLKKPTLDDELEKEYKRVKKKWDRAFKSKGGTPHPAGYFGKRRIRYAIEHYGKEEALRRIREAERYASGIAYTKNVEQLAGYIKDASQKYSSPSLSQLADDILENAYSIKDEWIPIAYEELYKLNDGVPPEEVARATRKILRL